MNKVKVYGTEIAVEALTTQQLKDCLESLIYKSWCFLAEEDMLRKRKDIQIIEQELMQRNLLI